MKEYKRFIEKESEEPKKSIRGQKTKPKKKAIEAMEPIDDNKELSLLREENKRLKKMVDKYNKESKSVIDKALSLKHKDKTSVLELLELFRLNDYLISHLPNSERLLEDYLLTKQQNVVSNGHSMASTSGYNSSNDSKKSSVSKTSKKSLNPISNYFQSVEKTVPNNDQKSGNKDNDSETSDKLIRRQSPRKMTKTVETNRKRKAIDSKPIEYISSEEELNSNDNNNDLKNTKTSDKRLSQSVAKNRKRDKTPDPETTSQTNESIDSTQDLKEDNNEKKKSKSGPKRSRRSRVPQKTGYFPCTFDPRQCSEIMDTKEHLDFHMSGHFDAKYVCPFCAYSGPTIQIIKRHMNTEREKAAKDVSEGVPLNDDLLAHKDIKIYRCFGCKVCDKIHDKMEKRCEHICEDSDNECDFNHDIDYEFKDHLKRHFNETFSKVKDKEERKKKIKPIIDRFVEELYFENNAKKNLLVEKFTKTKEKEQKSEGKPIEMPSDSGSEN